MTWFVIRFDETRMRPLAAWVRRGRMSSTGLSHRTVAEFLHLEDAWAVVGRHHKAGEVWGVISIQALDRLMKEKGLRPCCGN